MPKNKTKYEREYLLKDSNLGCIVCGQPATIHHLTGSKYRGMGKKASHYDVIPLCPNHHQHGGYGVAFHAGQKVWEAKYGTQEELLEKVKRKLDGTQNEYCW